MQKKTERTKGRGSWGKTDFCQDAAICGAGDVNSTVYYTMNGQTLYNVFELLISTIRYTVVRENVRIQKKNVKSVKNVAAITCIIGLYRPRLLGLKHPQSHLLSFMQLLKALYYIHYIQESTIFI